MSILLGHLQISPDDIHNLEEAERVVGSLPACITIVGDVENYPEGILEFLLDRAVRPMIAAGAKVERAMYRVDPKTPFPGHLLGSVPALPDALKEEVVAAGRKLMARKAASPAASSCTATDALWLDLRIPYATLDAFSTWLRETEIFPMRGTTTTGPARISPGRYSGSHSIFSGAFYGSDAAAVLSWLEAAGIPVERLSAPSPPDP